MWNSITGIITRKGDDFIYLQAGSLEWSISLSGYSISKLPASESSLKIYTYLHHKEDSMKLYGFAEESERNLFLELLKVGGIGPRGALKILSGISPEGFIRSLDDGDVDSLCRLPGLGKKTAQKIVLSLRGKLTVSEDSEKSEHVEIIESLVNMGFDKKLVKTAVKKVSADYSSDSSEGNGEEELFRQALILLSK